MCNLWGKKAAAAAAIIFLLILNACGEYDSIFPVNQTYQVSAAAGDHSLEEYAGIGSNDDVRPFFVHSIAPDQDIRGLTVSLQTPEGEEEELIQITEMDKELPGFFMPENLEIGPYRMIFQVLGEKGKIFAKTEKTIFYLADADYSIDGISAYLPGYSPDSHLTAPGTVIMLEAKITADERLDPYIVWYDGKKRIGEGKDVFLRIPEESGFRILKAEVFPFPPEEKAPFFSEVEGARGKIKELSLPVSIRGEAPEYLSRLEGEKEKFISHYLFAGDLLDSLSPYRELTGEKNTAAHWLGFGGIYGLAVGPRDMYLVPAEGPSGTERIDFSFRCKMLRDGTFFTATLPGISAEVPNKIPLRLELSGEKENFVLSLFVEGKADEKRILTALPAGEDFITFTFSLSFDAKGLTAALTPHNMTAAGVFMELDGLPAGEMIYQLGAPVPPKPDGEDEAPVERETEEMPVLILDELAITRGEAPGPAE